MKSTYFITVSAIIVLLFSCKKETNETPLKIQQKPNILFIMVDDLRPDLGCYGDTLVQSPHLYQLASEGVLFKNAYCNFPVCGASRASILTGLRPTPERFLKYNTFAQEDAPDAKVLPAYFKENGYTTISNGKIFHNKNDHEDAWDELWRPDPKNFSNFDYHTEENLKMIAEGTRGKAYERGDVPDSAYFDGRIAAKTIADLKKLKNSNQPFFLAAGFLKPHLPFNAPEKYWKLYDGKIKQPNNNFVPKNAPEISIHNSGELKQYREIPKKTPVADSTAIKLIHGYYACISYVDAQIGQVLQTLKELELDKNTIVVLMSDHGYNLQEHTMWCKHCNYKTSLQSTLMVKNPFTNKTGVAETLVEFVDVYPTLLEAAGLPMLEQLQGKSFMKVLENPNAEFKDFIIAKYNNGMTIKTHTEAYTEWIGKDAAPNNKMFYNHITDPKENTNTVAHPENKKLTDSLSKLLKENWGADFKLPDEE
ncbi:sulfatase [Galbibacter mesophilus]|uniref:sulfatase n=1 Tax=Galbibacter mesophilus TaxID=379069 RepID=UPI00191CE1FE|nr:sulfatase [Galbibacter mesophilus]MCM5663878.1 sulfatase [Galbibacter mesophilus]